MIAPLEVEKKLDELLKLTLSNPPPSPETMRFLKKRFEDLNIKMFEISAVAFIQENGYRANWDQLIDYMVEKAKPFKQNDLFIDWLKGSKHGH